MGSTYGMATKEREIALRNIGKDLGSTGVLGTPQLKCLEFLKEYIDLEQ